VDYSAPVLTLVRASPYLVIGLLGTVGLIVLAVRRRHAPEGWGGFAILTFALTLEPLLRDRHDPGSVSSTFLRRPVAGADGGGFMAASRSITSTGLRPSRCRLVAGAVRHGSREDFRSEATLYRAE
jgi:hypothetical protein